MLYRSRKQEKAYKKYRTRRKKTGEHTTCIFCEKTEYQDQLVKETRHFRVLQNRFTYSFWDGKPVKDHLMLVPKVHTDELASLPAEAKEEFFRLIEHYDKQGYDFFGRAQGSSAKTIAHQHTHLIKTGGKKRKLMFYTRKPYVRVTL